MNIEEVFRDLDVTYINTERGSGLLIISPRSGYFTSLEAHDLSEQISSVLDESGIDVPVLLINADITYVTKNQAGDIRDQLDRFLHQ